jgi:hypothetical protein
VCDLFRIGNESGTRVTGLSSERGPIARTLFPGRALSSSVSIESYTNDLNIHLVRADASSLSQYLSFQPKYDFPPRLQGNQGSSNCPEASKLELQHHSLVKNRYHMRRNLTFLQVTPQVQYLPADSGDKVICDLFLADIIAAHNCSRLGILFQPTRMIYTD